MRRFLVEDWQQLMDMLINENDYETTAIKKCEYRFEEKCTSMCRACCGQHKRKKCENVTIERLIVNEPAV